MVFFCGGGFSCGLYFEKKTTQSSSIGFGWYNYTLFYFEWYETLPIYKLGLTKKKSKTLEIKLTFIQIKKQLNDLDYLLIGDQEIMAESSSSIPS